MASRKCRRAIVLVVVGFCVSLFVFVHLSFNSVRTAGNIVIKKEPVAKKDKSETVRKR